MTKRDGDKLRAMRSEIEQMAVEYNSTGLTADALNKVGLAISAALRGARFKIVVQS